MSGPFRLPLRLALALAALALAACAKSTPTPGGLGDPCLNNNDCATGFLCSGGACVLPANLGGCQPGLLRCNGDDVEQCDPTGETWAVTDTCATGCVGGACAPQTCVPNTLRCDGDASEECAPDGNAWAFIQECPSHCDATTGACKAPICTPFATVCSADDLSILTCDSFGATQTSTPCATGSICENGACVAQVCTPGAKMCISDAAEVCAPDGSAWILVSICPSHCDTSTGLCKAPICTPFAVSCSADNSAVLTCDSFGASEISTPCAQGTQVCDTGRCQTVVCSPGTVRCASGSASTEVCNALGDGWSASGSCQYGCGSLGSVAGCLGPACAAGATECSPVSPSALEQCLPDQTGWAFETFCATGCEATGANTAACNPLVCSPLSRQCEADGIHVDTCNQLGTEWDQTDSCPQGCAAGQCVTTSAGCTPGELRCNGLDTQVCDSVPDDPNVTVWDLTGTCLTGCSSGACLSGGSCAALSLEVGAPQIAGTATAPADGESSVLVYSDPIFQEAAQGGAPIPDGQLFTISASIPGGASDGGTLQLALPTADADPATPGTQVATHGGRIRFTVPASALGAGQSATVQIAAQLEQGGSCSAQTSFALSTDPSVLGVTALVAEDFSTTTYRDAVNTSASWSTTQQELISAWPDAIGNGGDGNLSVASGSTNLATSGYAPAFAVLGLAAQSAVVDGTAQGLSGGDEVLLWDAQGSSSGTGNAGTYELLTVQSVDGSTVSFTTPVQNSYGAAADQDVATQRVSLQRVPHFATLTVAGGATLTTNAWDGTKGGLIFLRATKVVLGGTGTSQAIVDVSGLGFRGGTGGTTPTAGEDATGVAGQDGPGGGAGGAGSTGSGGSYGTVGAGTAVGTTYGSKLLGKLFLGAGGGGTTSGNAGTAGGGAVVIFADAIDFTSGGVTVGLVRANGASATSAGSGSGGSVWIGAPSMTVGPGSAVVAQASGATGGNKGGDGRIRIDEQTLDSPGFGGASCTRAAPACNFGVAGPVQGTSLTMFTVSGSQTAVPQANLLIALDATPSIKFFASAISSNGFLAVSTSSPAIFPPLSSTPPGPTFRWQALLSPDPSPAIGNSFVTGLQWQLQVK